MNLLRKLREYTPTEEEVLTKERMIAFVEKYPNCFDRTLEIGHITASAWLINKEGTKALLMHHAKINLWIQPGGHCDGDSNVLRVAIKEAQEESGIFGIVPVTEDIFDLDIHEFPEKNGIKGHLHYDVRFLLQVTSDEPLHKNEESIELRWFDSDLPTQHRSVTRMFKKWKNNNFCRLQRETVRDIRIEETHL